MIGERGSLLVESLALEREVGLTRVVPLSKDIFTPRKVLVIPGKRWLRSDMTEKLLTWTLSINTNKQTKHMIIIRQSRSRPPSLRLIISPLKNSRMCVCVCERACM